MSQRHNSGSDSQKIVHQLEQLRADDEYLTALSRGEQPANGADALADALLTLRNRAYRKRPETPDVEELLATASQSDKTSNIAATPPTKVSDGDAEVKRLDNQRTKTPTRKQHPFLHGLIGAAAATLLIAGGGTAVFNADPGSSLYSVKKMFLSKDKDVVELASTLEELDNRIANGDLDGVKELLAQIRKDLPNVTETNKEVRDRRAPSASSTADQPPSTEPTQASEAARVETSTVTETKVSTVTETVTLDNPRPSPTPTESPTKTTDPISTRSSTTSPSPLHPNEEYLLEPR